MSRNKKKKTIWRTREVVCVKYFGDFLSQKSILKCLLKIEIRSNRYGI